MRYILIILFTGALAVGCRPAKKVQKIETAITKKDSAVVQTGVDSMVLAEDVIEKVVSKKIDFNTFSGKVKFSYKGKDEENQATAYLRMKKDSIIWISVTGAFGIEGVRLLVTPDSVILMNKLNKSVTYRKISYLQDLTKVPMDFYDFQDLLIGNPVFLNGKIVSYKTNESGWLILLKGMFFKNLLTVSYENMLVTHSKLDDVDSTRNRTADITFASYENTGSFYFPLSRVITVSERSKLDIEMLFKSYNFDKPQDYPFNIPKSYSQE